MTSTQLIPPPTFDVRASNDLEEEVSSSKEFPNTLSDLEPLYMGIIYGHM